MNQPSGFVPIPFHRVGKLLLVAGGLGLGAVLIASVTHWVSLPTATLVSSLSAIAIGLYLIFVVPRNNDT